MRSSTQSFESLSWLASLLWSCQGPLKCSPSSCFACLPVACPSTPTPPDQTASLIWLLTFSWGVVASLSFMDATDDERNQDAIAATMFLAALLSPLYVLGTLVVFLFKCSSSKGNNSRSENRNVLSGEFAFDNPDAIEDC